MSNSMMIVLAAGVAPIGITAVLATAVQVPVVAAVTCVGVAACGAFVGATRGSRRQVAVESECAPLSSNAVMQNQTLDQAWQLS